MDIELYYQEKGTGEPLILLHGNNGSGDYFRHQIDYFQTHYRVLALDTRGHGKSPRGSAPFSIKQFSRDLYDFLQAHDIAKAVILGFSDGANIATEFALNHPEMIKALILNGGNLNPKGVKAKLQIPIELKYRIEKCLALFSKKAASRAEMLGLMVNEPNITPSELSRIAVPTLVICGTKDVIKAAHTRQIAASIPNVKLTFIEGGHAIAKNCPHDFNRAVDRFLKTI